MLRRMLSLAFFTMASNAFADEVSQIKLDMPILKEFGQLARSVDLVASVQFKSVSGKIVHEGFFPLSLNNGRLSGKYNLDVFPQNSPLICFSFKDPKINEHFVIFETCEPVTLSRVKKSSYRDLRQMLTPDQVYTETRRSIQRKLKHETSSDTALFERDREVQELILMMPEEHLDIYVARLISNIFRKSDQVGTRLPTTDYFSLGPEASSSLAVRLTQLVKKNRVIDKNTNYPAKTLFQAFLEVDLEQYSNGRPYFIDSFFRSLTFLAETRHKIAVENGYTGSTIAKELAVFCKDRVGLDFKERCLLALSRASDQLIGATTSRNRTNTREQISIALRYYSEARSEIKDKIDDFEIQKYLQ